MSGLLIYQAKFSSIFLRVLSIYIWFMKETLPGWKWNVGCKLMAKIILNSINLTPTPPPPKNIPKNILTNIWKETNNKTSRAFPWNYFTKFWKKLRVQVVSMHLFHIGLLFGARDYLGADSYPYYRGGWIAVKKSLNLQWARRLFFTFFSLLISKEIWTAIFASTGLRFC